MTTSEKTLHSRASYRGGRKARSADRRMRGLAKAYAKGLETEQRANRQKELAREATERRMREASVEFDVPEWCAPPGARSLAVFLRERLPHFPDGTRARILLKPREDRIGALTVEISWLCGPPRKEKPYAVEFNWWLDCSREEQFVLLLEQAARFWGRSHWGLR